MAGRAIILLLLIIILSVGGIIWFDFLNVIDAKSVLAPVYDRIPWLGDGRTQPKTGADDLLDMNSERYAMRLEALALRDDEIAAKERDLEAQMVEVTRISQQLDQDRIELEEMYNTIMTQQQDAENRDSNIDQLSRLLVGMPPQNAVSILANYDDQIAIDVIRKTEDNARAEGRPSIVAFWFSLMEPERAAEIQRKMAGRPTL
ncbi:MAG: flagellar protein FlbB [Treponema sp.]|nr:flagellar protein FlbB [Treponema sp.]